MYDPNPDEPEPLDPDDDEDPRDDGRPCPYCGSVECDGLCEEPLGANTP